MRQVREYVTRARDVGEVVDIRSRSVALTPAEVADLLGVSRSTISRKIKSGAITAVKVGAHHRIPRHEVERICDDFRPASHGAGSGGLVPDTDRVDYRRRLLYHHAVMAHLPSLDWDRAEANICKVEASVRGHLAIAAVRQWRELISSRDVQSIEKLLTEHSEHADLMRVVSPFAGIISEQERLAVIAAVRRRPEV